jgi:heterodisulfide reductase subunit C
MRIFTKEGFLKPKKSNEEKYCESLLENGWVEVNENLSPKTTKKPNKVKPKEDE